MPVESQLGRVARLARREEQRAAIAVRDARAAEARNLATLETFLGYRAEYARDLAGPGATLDPTRAGNLVRFIEQLERSIEGLEHQQTELQGCSTAAVEAWRRAAQRARATEDIVRRRQHEHAFEREERSQNELDDRFGTRARALR